MAGVLAGGLTGNLLAFSYPLYIAVLLIHMSMRDEKRCYLKYATSYDAYVQRVPYRMVKHLW
jgi:protein-S-isoprenylcysteine O-methyltransferase Ste14